jgi:hypothetical protein
MTMLPRFLLYEKYYRNIFHICVPCIRYSVSGHTGLRDLMSLIRLPKDIGNGKGIVKGKTIGI